jgi:hypothetical protein
MALTRKEHWATQDFHDFLMTRSMMPFAWGSNDCAMFAADAVHTITGVDIAAEFRGKYTDEDGAFALIRSVTGKGDDLATAVAEAAVYCAERQGLAEWPYTRVLMAKRGDLVVVHDSGRLIAGVIHLNGRHVVTVGAEGLKRLPITDVFRAWAV